MENNFISFKSNNYSTIPYEIDNSKLDKENTNNMGALKRKVFSNNMNNSLNIESLNKNKEENYYDFGKFIKSKHINSLSNEIIFKTQFKDRSLYTGIKDIKDNKYKRNKLTFNNFFNHKSLNLSKVNTIYTSDNVNNLNNFQEINNDRYLNKPNTNISNNPYINKNNNHFNSSSHQIHSHRTTKSTITPYNNKNKEDQYKFMTIDNNVTTADNDYNICNFNNTSSFKKNTFQISTKNDTLVKDNSSSRFNKSNNETKVLSNVTSTSDFLKNKSYFSSQRNAQNKKQEIKDSYYERDKVIASPIKFNKSKISTHLDACNKKNLILNKIIKSNFEEINNFNNYLKCCSKEKELKMSQDREFDKKIDKLHYIKRKSSFNDPSKGYNYYNCNYSYIQNKFDPGRKSSNVKLDLYRKSALDFFENKTFSEMNKLIDEEKQEEDDVRNNKRDSLMDYKDREIDNDKAHILYLSKYNFEYYNVTKLKKLKKQKLTLEDELEENFIDNKHIKNISRFIKFKNALKSFYSLSFNEGIGSMLTLEEKVNYLGDVKAFNTLKFSKVVNTDKKIKDINTRNELVHNNCNNNKTIIDHNRIRDQFSNRTIIEDDKNESYSYVNENNKQENAVDNKSLLSNSIEDIKEKEESFLSDKTIPSYTNTTSNRNTESIKSRKKSTLNIDKTNIKDADNLNIKRENKALKETKEIRTSYRILNNNTDVNAKIKDGINSVINIKTSKINCFDKSKVADNLIKLTKLSQNCLLQRNIKILDFYKKEKQRKKEDQSLFERPTIKESICSLVNKTKKAYDVLEEDNFYKKYFVYKNSDYDVYFEKNNKYQDIILNCLE